MPTPLTPRQRQIVDLIGKSARRLSVREICEQLGASNPTSVVNDLTALNRLGWLSADRRLLRRGRRPT